MKKRKRRPAREPVTQMRSRFQPDGSPFDFADGIWYDDRGEILAGADALPPELAEEGACAIKSEPHEEPASFLAAPMRSSN